MLKNWLYCFIEYILIQLKDAKLYSKLFWQFSSVATDSLIYHVKIVFQSVAESSTYPNNTGKSNVCNSF